MFDKSYNYNWLKPGMQWPWAEKTLQKLVWEKETPESLIKEFEYLLQNTNKEAWQKAMTMARVPDHVLEWPYIFNDASKDQTTI